MAWTGTAPVSEGWIGINSGHYEDHIGDFNDGTKFVDALDGKTYWQYNADPPYWAILDLGKSYKVTKMRGRASKMGDPTDVDIYVSDDKNDWGTPVKTGISVWRNTASWVEVEMDAQKTGRYVYIYVNECEPASPVKIRWGYNYPILDVYVVSTSGMEFQARSCDDSMLRGRGIRRA
jgi:hypothetical protein